MSDESPTKLAQILRSCRPRLGHEKLLQEDIEALFRENNVDFKREYVLGPGERVDFLVDGRIAVELKIKFPPRKTLRQIQRYATYDIVESIMLVSASAVSMPAMWNEKPVYVINLGAGYL